MDRAERIYRIREVLWQTWRDLVVDNAAEWAAAISYYAILSVFPLLLACVSIAAHFVDGEWATQRATEAIGQLLPGSGLQGIQTIIADTIRERGTAGLISIPVFLWTGSRVFQTLTKAINVFFDVDESYSFWKQRLVELIMLLSVGALFLFALASSFVVSILEGTLRILHIPDDFTRLLLGWVIPATLLLVSYFLMYRFVPRVDTEWKGCLTGAVVATFLFQIARPLFGEYLRRFANFDGVYGPPAVLVVLLVWIWLVALITLIGAELASHVQMILVEGRDPEEVGARHKRRAADKGMAAPPPGPTKPET